MRWPLRNQIFLRMLILVLIAIGATTLANIRSMIAKSRQSELGRLNEVSQLVADSRFPLTSSVLSQMKSLSGAEFCLTSPQGKVLATTDLAPTPSQFEIAPGSGKTGVDGKSVRTIQIGERSFYHASIKTNSQNDSSSPLGLVHVFMPRESETDVWWESSKSPLLIALLVLPVALVSSLALARQVTRPLAELNRQVQQISQGEIGQIPAVRGNDEITDLNQSINEMAVKLAEHDAQSRKNERLKTMVQFGNGIAHHLRNSATGCKMAVELLACDHQSVKQSENYQVAIRQLGLMDNYIRKFLLLSKSDVNDTVANSEKVRLCDVLDEVVYLLGPSAEHLNVALQIRKDCDESETEMPHVDAQQLMMNLVSNAITAASESQTHSGPQGRVEVELSTSGGEVDFSVTDNGSGPAAEISESMFQPFVTGSREGTGLGLALVKDIADRAGGRVDWKRIDGKTKFTFALHVNEIEKDS